MLMDEPFGAVDPIVRERLQNEFLRLQEQLAKTILFVTHDIDEAIKMGDLVAVFRAGGIVAQFGPPSEILAAPASDVRRPVRRRRPRAQAAVAHPGRRPASSSPAVTARVGDDAAEVRRRVARRGRRSATCCCVDADDRPLGWVDERRIPASGPPRRRPGRGDVAAPRPADDAQGRAVDAARRRRPGRRRRRPARGAIAASSRRADRRPSCATRRARRTAARRHGARSMRRRWTTTEG